MELEAQIAQFDGKTADEMDSKIEQETIEWEKINLSIANLSGNFVNLECRIMTIEFLVRDMIAREQNREPKDVQDEINLMLKKLILLQMTGLRAEIEPQLRAQRLAAAGISLPGNNEKIH